jgi:hypothetical protein
MPVKTKTYLEARKRITVKNTEEFGLEAKLLLGGFKDLVCIQVTGERGGKVPFWESYTDRYHHCELYFEGNTRLNEMYLLEKEIEKNALGEIIRKRNLLNPRMFMKPDVEYYNYLYAESHWVVDFLELLSDPNAMKSVVGLGFVTIENQSHEVQTFYGDDWYSDYRMDEKYSSEQISRFKRLKPNKLIFSVGDACFAGKLRLNRNELSIEYTTDPESICDEAVKLLREDTMKLKSKGYRVTSCPAAGR